MSQRIYTFVQGKSDGGKELKELLVSVLFHRGCLNCLLPDVLQPISGRRFKQ